MHAIDLGVSKHGVTSTFFIKWLDNEWFLSVAIWNPMKSDEAPHGVRAAIKIQEIYFLTTHGWGATALLFALLSLDGSNSQHLPFVAYNLWITT